MTNEKPIGPLCSFWFGLPIGIVIGVICMMALAAEKPFAIRDSYTQGILDTLNNRTRYKVVVHGDGIMTWAYVPIYQAAGPTIAKTDSIGMVRIDWYRNSQAPDE